MKNKFEKQYVYYTRRPFFDSYDKKVAIAVGVMVVACGIIYVVMNLR